MDLLAQKLAHKLKQQQQSEHYRQPVMIEAKRGTQIRIAGQWYINFASNDYLGLADHPAIVRSFKRALDEFGVGSGGSYLVTGYTRPHQQLEQALAEFTGRDRALLFTSGYSANMGVLKSLLDKNARILMDKLNHASLIDGALASEAALRRYPHLDTERLEQLLHDSDDCEQTLVVTDSVFSMDGDLAPVDTIARQCEKHFAWLMVDDAHGFGVLGERGAGICEQFSLDQRQLPILMATFGKALGTSGAFVAGSEESIDYLVQFCRHSTYTTAMPPAQAQATLTALRLAEQENWRRAKLKQLIQRFRAGVGELGYQLMASDTAIQPLVIGQSCDALKLAEHLRYQGIWATAIRPPTVPAGTARIRITLTAAHSEQEVDQLLDALERARQLPSARQSASEQQGGDQ